MEKLILEVHDESKPHEQLYQKVCKKFCDFNGDDIDAWKCFYLSCKVSMDLSRLFRSYIRNPGFI
jgi:hypothetical protein